MAYVKASDFIAMLERSWAGQEAAAAPHEASNAAADIVPQYRIPTGPFDPVDLQNTQDTLLEVVGAVDLRGRTLPGSVLLYGVQFRGRVDLRSATIQGETDLTACVFEEELLLDDLEVDGSLRIARMFARKLSMNGVVVRGRLDASGTRTSNLEDPKRSEPIRLFNANIEDYVDLRGVSAPAIELNGSHIRGDLRLGFSNKTGRIASRVGKIDASNCVIGGDVNIVGTGTAADLSIRSVWLEQFDATDLSWPDTEALQTAGLDAPALTLEGSSINGNVQIVPYIGKSARHRWAPDQWMAAETDAVVWPVLHSLDLAGATIGSNLFMAGALILHQINAPQLKIGGAFHITVGELYRKIDSPQGPSSYVWQMRRTEIRNIAKRFVGVLLEGLHISGKVALQGVHIAGSLDLSSAKLEGSMEIAGFEYKKNEYTPSEFTMPTEIENNLELYLALLGSVVLLQGVRINGNFNLWGVVSRAHVRLMPQGKFACSIGNEFDAHSAQLLQLDLRGIEVKGPLRLVGCRMLHILIGPGLLELGGAPSLPESSHEAHKQNPWHTQDAILLPCVGHLLMEQADIKGNVALNYLQVTGREWRGRTGLLIHDSSVGGSVTFNDSVDLVRLYEREAMTYAQAMEACPIDPAAFNAAVIGNLEIKRTKVGGATRLGGVKVDGSIDLEDSHFGGDLCIKPLLHSNRPGPSKSNSDHASPSMQPNPAICKSVKLRMVKCDNDVDLTGLTVRSHLSGDLTDEIPPGHVDGRFVHVNGDLIAFRNGNHAELDGQLDLSYANLAHLEVAGCIFTDAAHDDTKPPRSRLVVERIPLPTSLSPSERCADVEMMCGSMHGEGGRRGELGRGRDGWGGAG